MNVIVLERYTLVRPCAISLILQISVCEPYATFVDLRDFWDFSHFNYCIAPIHPEHGSYIIVMYLIEHLVMVTMHFKSLKLVS